MIIIKLMDLKSPILIYRFDKLILNSTYVIDII